MIVLQIAKLLHAQGIGILNESGAGGSIYIGFSPATPDASITLTPKPAPLSDAKLAYDFSAFQVRVRDRDIRLADSKAQAVYNALHGLGMITLPDGTYLLTCTAFTPGYMGVDEVGRHEYVFSCQCEVSNNASNIREA
jgi:hypothetical protein